MDQQKTDQAKELEKFKPKPSSLPAIISLLSSISAGLCWLFRDFTFRHAVTSGEKGQSWFMMDVNVALRRGLLIFALIAIFAGFAAVTKRGKFFDFLAFIISVTVCLTVGWVVYQMGGKGFWLAK